MRQGSGVLTRFSLTLITCMTLAILGTSHAQAADANARTERVFERTGPNGQLTYITVRGENELWVVEAFARSSDGWQERLWRKSFHLMSEVEKSLKPLRLKERPLSVLEQAAEIRGARAGEALWKVKESWSLQWEQRYADWVMKNADPEFFQRYQIATDCADVAYSMRWIFARIHGLPVASRLAGSGDLLTQDSVRSEWLRYPTGNNWWEDKRFLKALDYLMNNTYTHTLVRDGYPIEISPQALTPGAFFLRLFGKTGHTQYVHRTYYDNPTALPLKLMASTVPRSVRSLFETDFWEAAPPVEGEGGFMHFRWPLRTARGTTMVPAEQMPFYSLAQFKPEFMGKQEYFAMAVLVALNPDFSLEKWLQSGIADIKSQLAARKDIVEKGSAICAQKSCAPGTAEYEDWSTPSRDKRLGQLLAQLESVARMPDHSETLRPLWQKALREPAFELNGTVHSLNTVLFTWSEHMYSSEPMVSISRRWGIEPTGFIENFAERLTTLLAGRDKKIIGQGVACSNGSCPTNGTEWQKWQTFTEDQQLVRLRYIDRTYCTTLPDFCVQYEKQRNNQVIKLNGAAEPLSSWLEKVVWLNSDPNQSKENRWGAMRDRFRSVVLRSDLKEFVSKSGWMVRGRTGSASGVSIDHVVTGETAAPPNGFRWSQLSSEGDWALAISSQGNEVVLQHLATGQQTRFPFQVDPDNSLPLFTGGNALIPVSSKSMIRIVKLDSSPAHIGDIAGVESFGLSGIAGVILVTLQSEAVEIHDLRVTPKRYDAPKEITGKGHSRIAVKFETSRFLIVEHCVTQMKCQSFSVDKATGEWKRRPHLDWLVTFAGPHHVFRNEIDFTQGESLAKIEQIDENLELISSRKIGNFVQYKDPYVCADDQRTERTTCYTANPDRFDDRPIFTDRTLVSWDKDFIAWTRPGETNHQLSAAAAPNRVLYSSSWIGSSNSLEPGWFIARTGQNYHYRLLVDAKRPNDGVVVTSMPSQGRADSGYSFATTRPIHQRGLTINLASEELLWIERK